MKTMQLGKSGLMVPVIGVGCWRMHRQSMSGVETMIQTALEQGLNFFDHADMYGGGACEEIFAKAIHMTDDIREKIILQSKCGITKTSFDFSKEHILEAVDGSLQRLKTDYLDVLLLHRPDALVEPEEVAEAFDILKSSGKVHHFGVSNQNPMQIQLLQKYLHQPLVTNQLQLSIMFAGMISAGIHVNMQDESAVNRDGSILDFCRLNDITIQAWSPFQYGFNQGVFLDKEKFPKLNVAIDKIAEKYQVPNTAVVLAWILRHPAHIQPITGTMNADRIKDCAKAADITLTRQEWYDIYLAAGNILP